MTNEARPPDGVDSVALWLGAPDRPLFSWLDVPSDGLVAGAAVLCPTMGLESESSARALRDLAHRLAASRWAVLRVDYAGTGDSAGTWTDPDLVADWLDGVRTAIEYARALGTARVGVIGLRIGATLAAAELDRGGGVDDLVLWDPCATGRAYLREQRALWAFLRDQATEWGRLGEGETWGSGGSSDDGALEAPGILFTTATVSQLEPLTIAPSDRSLASRELLLSRQGRRLAGVLAERLTLSHVESMEVSGQEALLDLEAITPERTLDRIVSWLTEVDGPVVRVEVPNQRPTAVHRGDGGPGVLERPVEMGPAHLFGMLSEPEDQVDPLAPIVVFLNAGRIGHHGPARLWVDLSRRWAAEGMRCMRVDLSGIGDSPTRPGRTELVEFPADALEDLADITRAASAQGGPGLAFVGLCSGAYHAVEAALAAPPASVASVCLVNPALTYHRWGQHPYRRFEPNEASPTLSDRQAWGSTRPWLSRVMLRLAALRTAGMSMPDGGWWIVKRLFMMTSPARTVERLVASDVDVLIVAGSEEARLLCRGEERRFRALVGKGRLRMETVPNLEHTLFERTGRERVSEMLHAHLVRGLRRHAPAGPRPIRHLPA